MIVGLTGGIGSGKSCVAKQLRDLGISVIEADDVARNVVKPGTEALKAVHHRFGDAVMQGNELNRRAIRDIIFKEAHEKAWLEALLHPLIRKQMMSELAQSTSPYKVLEAPLLFENGLDSLCERTVVVDISEQEQTKRVMTRDSQSEQQIQAIINSQMPRKDRLAKADYVIDNNGKQALLEPQVLRLHNLLSLLSQNTLM